MLILLPGRSGAGDNRRVPDDKMPDGEMPDGEMPDDEMEAESRATDRLTLFSDAVVAIAITLLAIDLRCPRAVRCRCSGNRSGTTAATTRPS
jgi:hypothetical protein